MALQTLQVADQAIGVSRFIASILSKLGASCVEVVPNGYDSRLFELQPHHHAAGTKVCYLGHISRHKGVFDLLRAYVEVKLRVPFASLTYVGDGPDIDALRSTVRSQRVTDVRFEGSCPHEKVPAVLKAHDVFVLPSYTEGLPTALVVAMAAGLAVIASKVGGIPELVIDNVNGLLVSPGDIKGLAHVLHMVLTDRVLQMRIRREARATVQGKYSWRAISLQLIGLYGRALGIART